MDQIGILTLAKHDDTPAFREFRRKLRRDYQEGMDVSLHFQFARNDNELSNFATYLTRMPNIKVIVTGGMNALAAVRASGTNTPIVHVGDQVPAGPGITGYFLSAPNMLQTQLDYLLSHPGNVTVLMNSPDSANNTVYQGLVTHAGGNAGRLKPLVAKNRATLAGFTSADVADSFMIIPSGMLYDERTKVINLARKAGQNALTIYPEIEYKLEHNSTFGDTANIWVHGHDIKATFGNVADRVHDFLVSNQMQPAAEAVRYSDLPLTAKDQSREGHRKR